MCMSPHEMTSTNLELRINEMRRLVRANESNGRPLTTWERNVYIKRSDWFEEILKERANNGTYYTAGV